MFRRAPIRSGSPPPANLFQTRALVSPRSDLKVPGRRAGAGGPRGSLLQDAALPQLQLPPRAPTLVLLHEVRVARHRGATASHRVHPLVFVKNKQNCPEGRTNTEPLPNIGDSLLAPAGVPTVHSPWRLCLVYLSPSSGRPWREWSACLECVVQVAGINQSCVV